MMLQEKDRQAVQKRFAELDKPVRLINFTQEIECQYCRETRALLEEVAALSDKLTLQVFNFQTDREQRDTYKIDKIPATVILGEEDQGIRYYGIPSGYEFATLLETILMISKGESGLSPETRKKLRDLKNPLHLEVYVTPT